MTFKPGYIYFIKDEFFQYVQDPNLKINYASTKRPHYYAVKDRKTDLLWFIPCSTKVEKFERIIAKRKKNKRATPTIIIAKIAGKRAALLLQDMFPIAEKYVDSQYIWGGQPVRVADADTVKQIERAANQVIGMIRAGIRFLPTQPDAMRIEQLMLKETQEK